VDHGNRITALRENASLAAIHEEYAGASGAVGDFWSSSRREKKLVGDKTICYHTHAFLDIILDLIWIFFGF
jgi:hypothetical protein